MSTPFKSAARQQRAAALPRRNVHLKPAAARHLRARNRLFLRMRVVRT